MNYDAVALVAETLRRDIRMLDSFIGPTGNLVDLIIDDLSTFTRPDVVRIMVDASRDWAITRLRSRTKRELLQLIRNRLTARARAELRNYC